VPEQLPQQRIEEAREEKGKKGAESGDPPTRKPRGRRVERQLFDPDVTAVAATYVRRDCSARPMPNATNIPPVRRSQV
jgi:hypothetical protein